MRGGGRRQGQGPHASPAATRQRRARPQCRPRPCASDHAEGRFGGGGGFSPRFVRPRGRERALVGAALAALCLLAACAGSAAAAIRVAANGSDAPGCGAAAAGCRTLRFALSLAAAGDTIRLAKGEHAAGGELQPRVASLTIEGETGDAADVVVDGASASRIFFFGESAPGIRLRALTLRRGKAWTGGCLLFDQASNTSAASLVEHVVFDSCSASGLAPTVSGSLLPYVANAGGAIYFATAASPRLSSVVFRSNFAALAGGGVWTHDDAAPLFEDCRWEGNKADGFGGGMVPEGRSRPVVRRGVFVSNVGPFGGAVDSGLSSAARFEDCRFESNFAPWSGGAVYHYGDDRLSFARCAFLNNGAGGGGGGAVAVSTTCAPVYEDCRFEGSYTVNGGGGHVVMTGTTKITVRRSTFRASRAAQGGAFYQRGLAIVTLEDVVSEGSRSTQWGGGFMGVWGDGNVVRMRNVVVRDAATAADPGGFLRLQGQVTVEIAGSRVENCSASLGSIATSEQSRVTVTNSNFTDNYADFGGVVAIADDSFVAIHGGLLARNRARVHAGAAYLNGRRAKLLINGTELRCNHAPMGGAVYVEDAASVDIRDALFRANRADYGAALGVGEDFCPEGDPSACALSATNTRFEGNAAVVAGGVAYYFQLQPSFTLDAATVLVNNSADWGPDSATLPDGIVVDGPGLIRASPGQQFVVRARMLDGLGQTIASAKPPVMVELAASSGLQITTLSPVKVFTRGVAEFELSVAVEGSAARNFTLALASDAGSASLALLIQPCLPGYSALETATSYRCTACGAGTYNLAGDGACLPCPAGAVCPGRTAVLAATGFWVEPASLARGDPTLYRCPRGFCCPEGSCDLANPCASAREGTLCGSCIAGYSDWGGTCKQCASPQYALLALPFLAGSGLVLGSWILSSGTLTSGKVKSLIFFVQAVALVMQDEVGSLFASLTWDVALSSSLSCPFSISSFHRTLLGYWVPAFAFILLILTIAGVLAVDRLRAALGGKRASARARDRLAFMAFQISTIAYIAIGNTSIKYLDCATVGEERVLRRFPGVSCASPEYRQWLPLAWVMLVAYVAGLPLVFVSLVYLLNRKGVMYQPETMQTYGMLYACYRTPWKYYEVVVLGRRILLIALDTAFGGRENLRALSLFLAALLFAGLHALVRPYAAPLDNSLEAMFLLVLSLAAALEVAVSASFAAPEYPIRGLQYALYGSAFLAGGTLIALVYLRRAVASRRTRPLALNSEEGEEEEVEAGDEAEAVRLVEVVSTASRGEGASPEPAPQPASVRFVGPLPRPASAKAAPAECERPAGRASARLDSRSEAGAPSVRGRQSWRAVNLQMALDAEESAFPLLRNIVAMTAPVSPSGEPVTPRPASARGSRTPRPGDDRDSPVPSGSGGSLRWPASPRSRSPRASFPAGGFGSLPMAGLDSPPPAAPPPGPAVRRRSSSRSRSRVSIAYQSAEAAGRPSTDGGGLAGIGRPGEEAGEAQGAPPPDGGEGRPRGRPRDRDSPSAWGGGPAPPSPVGSPSGLQIEIPPVRPRPPNPERRPA